MHVVFFAHTFNKQKILKTEQWTLVLFALRKAQNFHQNDVPLHLHKER